MKRTRLFCALIAPLLAAGCQPPCEGARHTAQIDDQALIPVGSNQTITGTVFTQRSSTSPPNVSLTISREGNNPASKTQSLAPKPQDDVSIEWMASVVGRWNAELVVRCADGTVTAQETAVIDVRPTLKPSTHLAVGCSVAVPLGNGLFDCDGSVVSASGTVNLGFQRANVQRTRPMPADGGDWIRWVAMDGGVARESASGQVAWAPVALPESPSLTPDGTALLVERSLLLTPAADGGLEAATVMPIPDVERLAARRLQPVALRVEGPRLAIAFVPTDYIIELQASDENREVFHCVLERVGAVWQAAAAPCTTTSGRPLAVNRARGWVVLGRQTHPGPRFAEVTTFSLAGFEPSHRVEFGPGAFLLEASPRELQRGHVPPVVAQQRWGVFALGTLAEAEVLALETDLPATNTLDAVSWRSDGGTSLVYVTPASVVRSAP